MDKCLRPDYVFRLVSCSIRQPFAGYANEFGFTQAAGLQTIGFPYVAVAHLVVSDESPRTAWRDMGVVRILDKHGRVELLDPVAIDCLPIDLMERCFGRLCGLARDDQIGLIAAYPRTPGSSSSSDAAGWHPEVREAKLNPNTNGAFLHRLAKLFDLHPEIFLDNPRWCIRWGASNKNTYRVV